MEIFVLIFFQSQEDIVKFLSESACEILSYPKLFKGKDPLVAHNFAGVRILHGSSVNFVIF